MLKVGLDVYQQQEQSFIYSITSLDSEQTPETL
jgi:hypothetical protein